MNESHGHCYPVEKQIYQADAVEYTMEKVQWLPGASHVADLT